MNNTVLALSLAAVVAGCSSKESGDQPGVAAADPSAQTEAEAWKAACEVTRVHAEELAGVNPAERQALLSKWVSDALKNERARATFDAIANQSPQERGRTFEAALAQSGIEFCHLAEVTAHDGAVYGCRMAGDAAACVVAAEIYQRDKLFPGRQAESVSYREAACIHGDGAQCAAVAASGEPAMWHGRACRRGHRPSCDQPGARSSYDAVTLKVTPAGPAAGRIEGTYAAAVADCLAAERKPGTAGGELRFRLTVDIERGSLAVAADGELFAGMRDCLAREVARWRFVEPPRQSLAVVATWPGEASPRADAKLAEEEVIRQLAVLMSDMDDNATSGSMMSGRDVGRDLDDSIASIKESGAEVSGVGIGSSENGSTRGTSTIETGGARGAERKAVAPPAAVVKVASVTADDDSSLKSDDVAAAIRRKYLLGLKRCMQATLKVDAKAAGTVKLKIQVGESGRVTRAQARGFGWPTLDQCVESRAKTWRFSVPKDVDGDPVDADFRISLPMMAK